MDINFLKGKNVNQIESKKFYSVDFAINELSNIYQFKIWSTPANPFFILVKEDSELIRKLNVGDVIRMKYYSSVSDYPKELVTEIKSITHDLYGGFKGHYLVGLKILQDQNG